jgi:hypothetical protein
MPINTSDPLSKLKDIHLPQPPGWWPPAIGWWILGVLLLALVIGSGYLLWRKHKRNRWLRLAWKELERLHGLTQASPVFFGQVNSLLKRASRLRYPDSNTDSLTGDAWLSFLQEKAPGLPADDLRRLVESCWHPKPSLAPSRGLKLAGDWLRAQKC